MRGILLAGCLILTVQSGMAFAQPGRGRDNSNPQYLDMKPHTAMMDSVPTQFVRVQVKIIALQKGSLVNESEAKEKQEESELLFPSMERLKELEKAGLATSITRAEVVTGNGIEASWHHGEKILVPMRRSLPSFGRSVENGQPSNVRQVQNIPVTLEQVGTLIRVTPKVQGEKIVTTLSLEQSVGSPTEPGEITTTDTAPSQPLQQTYTVNGTIPLSSGAPIIVGGYQTIDFTKGQPTETFYVVVMSAQLIP